MTLTAVALGRSAVLALARLRAWPVESQQRARRNAMVAATACAQRRAEREDVASFLSERYRPASAAPAEIPGPDAGAVPAPVRRVARG